MATSADGAAPAPPRYPDGVLEEFARIAEECRICYQCGQCTSACPSGRDLDRGPRRIVRLTLAGEIEAVLTSDDLWRCTECGSCTDACRMDIDVTGVLARLRALERETGGLRCPERAAADIASKRLEQWPRIDNLAFGVAMAGRGHAPRDIVGAAGTGARLARQMLPFGRDRAGGPADAAWPAGRATEVTLPYYAGCALPQDHELSALVRRVAAGFGVALAEASDAGCCGHPSRGAVPTRFTSEERVHTACPACDVSLRAADVDAVPLWDELTDRAARRGLGLTAAAPTFVPYVGCLADRDAALAKLDQAATLASAEMLLAFPTLHNACCGALGGMYRGATQGSRRLLEFAAAKGAPVVTPCVLCRDNLRAAARQSRRDVPVHFWPEFFRAAEGASHA